MNTEANENSVVTPELIEAGERYKAEANEYFKSKFLSLFT